MQILGITIDKPFLKVALIEKNQKRSSILYLKSLPYNEPENVKQLYKTAFKGKIISALSAKNLLIRPLEITSNSSKHLEQIIAFQSEATSYFNESEVLSIPCVLDQNKEKMRVMLFTASRARLRDHIELLEKNNLDPDCITASPLALIHYIKWKMPHLQDAFIVDIGSEEWTCVFMEKGNLKKFHSISGGIDILLEALWEDRKKVLFPKEISSIAKQIDLLQLKASLNSQLSSTLISMRQELSRIIYSFSCVSGQKSLFFTGRVDAFGGLQEFLEEGLGDSVSPNLFEEIPKEEQKHAIAIGLAVGYSPKSVQFRQDEFFPKKTWRKMGLSSLFLMGASLFFTALLFGFSNYSLKSKSQRMICSLRTSLNDWDRALAKEIFIPKNEEAIVNRWNKAAHVHSKEYVYTMRTPKVAEILSWLYQHPNMLEDCEINYVRYQMDQYPKIDTPKDPYQAKLEIEFTTKSPLNARKFHEAIYQGDGPVDNTQDIHWEANDTLYRVSFYVKKELNHAS